MKKTLCILLTLILVFSTLSTAFADYEETEGTPYGIPLFASAEEVDLAAVITGHTYRRLLNCFSNLEVKKDLLQIQSDDTYDMLLDDFYFLDNGQYVNYCEQTSKKFNSTTYQLFLYDKEDPYTYSKYPGGRDKYEVPAEYIDSMLDNIFVPFYPNYFDVKMTSAELVDGLYVCQYTMTAKENLPEDVVINTTYDDCSLTIEPETSLIRGFTYHQVSEYADATVSAEVNYNVDKQPDYSIKY